MKVLKRQLINEIPQRLFWHAKTVRDRADDIEAVCDGEDFESYAACRDYFQKCGKLEQAVDVAVNDSHVSKADLAMIFLASLPCYRQQPF